MGDIGIALSIIGSKEEEDNLMRIKAHYSIEKLQELELKNLKGYVEEIISLKDQIDSEA